MVRTEIVRRGKCVHRRRQLTTVPCVQWLLMLMSTRLTAFAPTWRHSFSSSPFCLMLPAGRCWISVSVRVLFFQHAVKALIFMPVWTAGKLSVRGTKLNNWRQQRSARKTSSVAEFDISTLRCSVKFSTYIWVLELISDLFPRYLRVLFICPCCWFLYSAKVF